MILNAGGSRVFVCPRTGCSGVRRWSDLLALGAGRPKPSQPHAVEDLLTFSARVAELPPIGWHARELVPEEGIFLWHGQPRDMKSLCALAVGLAMAGGYDPFDLTRFHVKRPVRVAYVTEEDPEKLFHYRAGAIMRRKGDPAPGMFFPLIRKGVRFDNPAEQDRLLNWIGQTDAEVLFLDPLRGFTTNADKGPADFGPVTAFLRQIQNDTLAKSLGIVHHDVKPLRQTQNLSGRSRSHEASGGGVFSISECPVSFQKIAWNKTVATPSDYKLSGDPLPFEVTFKSDTTLSAEGTERFGSWIWPTADTTSRRNAEQAGDRDKLVAAMRAKPGKFLSTDAWETEARLGKGKATALLHELHESGLADYKTGDDAKALGFRSGATKAYAWLEGGSAVGSDAKSPKSPEVPGGLWTDASLEVPPTVRRGLQEGSLGGSAEGVKSPDSRGTSNDPADSACGRCGGPAKAVPAALTPDEPMPAVVGGAGGPLCGLCANDGGSWPRWAAGPES